MRSRLACEGLNIVIPLSAGDFDAAVGDAPDDVRIDALLANAGGALLIGDGGPGFFQRFQTAARDQRLDAPNVTDPLDDYTVKILDDVVSDSLSGPSAGGNARVLFPFVRARPALPFQRLGQAAGLPAPGPLGIQIHPEYGPWWAYRALIVVPFQVTTRPSVVASCSGCARPCVVACPAGAVQVPGFSHADCAGHRSWAPACLDSCAARHACPVGTRHRYSVRQLAFHMSRSLPMAGDHQTHDRRGTE